MATSTVHGGAVAPDKVDVEAPVVTARDLFVRLDEQARKWLSLIESTLETHRFAPNIYPQPREPLPQWAADRLGDEGKLAQSSMTYDSVSTMLAEALDIAAGEPSNIRYEIWEPGRSPHTFKRLENRSESLQEARERLEALRTKHPDAHIMQVDKRHVGGAVHGIELAHTLVGRLHHAGTAFPREGDEVFEIQDETGRTIAIEASVLRAHPIFNRLSAEAKDSVDQSLRHTERKARLRAEAAANGHEGQL